MKKSIKLFSTLTIGLLLFAMSCQKAEIDNSTLQEISSPENYSKAEIKIGEEVSQDIVQYLELITHNSMSVIFENGKPSLSQNAVSSRELVSGTINTNKEVIVNNEYNKSILSKLIMEKKEARPT